MLLETVLAMASDEERQRLLNFVIVGGGPTGVELAGALSELKHHVLPDDYDELDFASMNIYLVEGLPRGDVSGDDARAIQQGRQIAAPVEASGDLLRLYGPHSDFLGVGSLVPGRRIAPRRLLQAPPGPSA